MKKKITVNLKFYSGIDKDLDLKNYDPQKGIDLEVDFNIRLRKLMKQLGFRNISGHVIFSGGERVSRWHKLRNGDSVSILKPAGGG